MPKKEVYKPTNKAKLESAMSSYNREVYSGLERPRTARSPQIRPVDNLTVDKGQSLRATIVPSLNYSYISSPIRPVEHRIEKTKSRGKSSYQANYTGDQLPQKRWGRPQQAIEPAQPLVVSRSAYQRDFQKSSASRVSPITRRGATPKEIPLSSQMNVIGAAPVMWGEC
eukprot:TRINITY_DN0_c1754_g1_i2.p1 TRINITY_DN0_c1754_g1~~TRINITY_DN0_c1754_g1_i2.p1  ORF type:complete len:169 (+),score=25.43 TRINITY_DN0_c1754_g1_i2:62-568(+)